MNLVDIVAEYADDSRRVFAHEDASALASRVVGVETLSSEPPTDGVVIHRSGTGAEASTLGQLAAMLDRGVGVLLMERDVTALPVGALLHTLGEAGLRALSVNSLALSGVSSVLVVSRDESIPLRSHVLGEAFSTGTPAAALRRDNEMVLESVVSRARISALASEVQARAQAEQSLVDKVHDLESQLARQKQEVSTARAEVQRLERALTALERRSPGYRAMRLARRVREDPLSAGRDAVDRLGRTDKS